MKNFLFLMLATITLASAPTPARAFSMEQTSKSRFQTASQHSNADVQGKKLKWKGRLSLQWLAKKGHTSDTDRATPLAFTGFILGLVGIVTLSWSIVWLAACAGAIVISLIALKRSKRSGNKRDKFLAIAGLVMGCVGLGLLVLRMTDVLLYHFLSDL